MENEMTAEEKEMMAELMKPLLEKRKAEADAAKRKERSEKRAAAERKKREEYLARFSPTEWALIQSNPMSFLVPIYEKENRSPEWIANRFLEMMAETKITLAEKKKILKMQTDVWRKRK